MVRRYPSADPQDHESPAVPKLNIGDRVKVAAHTPCDKGHRVWTGIGVIESFTKTGRVKIRWQYEDKAAPKRFSVMGDGHSTTTRFSMAKNLELVPAEESQ